MHIEKNNKGWTWLKEGKYCKLCNHALLECHPDELVDAGNELIIAQLPFELIINPFALFTLKLAKMAIVRPGKPDGELDT